MIALELNPSREYCPSAVDFLLRLQVPALIDQSLDAINKDWLPWPLIKSRTSPLGCYFRRSRSLQL
jgi:hypothetical protein